LLALTAANKRRNGFELGSPEVGVEYVDSWAVQIPVWVVLPILFLLILGAWKLVKSLILASKG
jgi:hypothetical protein